MLLGANKSHTTTTASREKANLSLDCKRPYVVTFGLVLFVKDEA
jgi:hypothetical protein